MSNIKNTAEQLVGNTPLLRLNQLEKELNLEAKLLGKLESFNLTGSVKDRIALNMIKQAEMQGVLKEGSIIVEATSGNTGIGLAAIGTAKGYEVILVMPETMTVERRQLMKAYGAKIELTSGALGMKGAIARSLEMKAENDKVFIPSQFDNLANPAVHYETTGPEIYRDTEGHVDILVAGVGTGGTITGAGRFLKEKNPNVHIVAVEPKNSPVLSGGQPGPHKIQGIGAGFVPSVLDQNIYNEVVTVSDEDAITTARLMGHHEGALIGISSGAALFAAIELAQKPENKGKSIVVILPDGGDRYMSTPLFE